MLPGLVNTHHHLYQTLTRAVPGAQDVGLFDWLRTLYPIWARMTAEHIRVSTQIGLAELALSGCTTAFDQLYLYPNDSRFDDEVEAAIDVGIRLMASRGSMSLGESAGGLPPDSVVETEDAILADCARVIDTFHDPSPGAMTQVVLAPCSPFSVTLDLMRESARLARDKGVRLHTHLAETLDEEQFCLDTHGRRPVGLMEDVEWVGDDVWYAHGVFIADDEIARMAETRHRRRPLPVVEHAARVGYRPGAALSGRRACPLGSAWTGRRATTAATCSPRPGRHCCSTASRRHRRSKAAS